MVLADSLAVVLVAKRSLEDAAAMICEMCQVKPRIAGWMILSSQTVKQHVSKQLAHAMEKSAIHT